MAVKTWWLSETFDSVVFVALPVLSVAVSALSDVVLSDTSRHDQFLMKLRPEYDNV